MALKLTNKITRAIIQNLSHHRHCNSAVNGSRQKSDIRCGYIALKTPYQVCEENKTANLTYKHLDENPNTPEDLKYDMKALQPSNLPEVDTPNSKKYEFEREDVDKHKDILTKGFLYPNSDYKELGHLYYKVPAAVKPFPTPYHATTSSSPCHEDILKSKVALSLKSRKFIKSFGIRKFSSAADAKDGKCGKPKQKCKTKTKCKPETKCPHMILPDCECRTVTECTHPWRGPPCKKQLAPYPSYSESCAEQLDPDPSECVQCPWKRCPVDKKGTKRKKFHTYARILSLQSLNNTVPQSQYHTTRVESTSFDRQMPLENFANLVTNDFEFDARKEPCKRPPGKCPKPKEDVAKKPKCIPPKKKDKKKCKGLQATWTEAYQLWLAKKKILNEPIAASNPISWDLKDKKEQNYERFKYDEREADYEHKRKRQCVKEDCVVKKKKKTYGDCPKDECTQKTKGTMDELSEQIAYELADKCPDADIIRPNVDHSVDEKYRPEPCCPTKKNPLPRKYRKHRKNKQPRVYVPTKTDYDNMDL